MRPETLKDYGLGTEHLKKMRDQGLNLAKKIRDQGQDPTKSGIRVVTPGKSGIMDLHNLCSPP